MLSCDCLCSDAMQLNRSFTTLRFGTVPSRSGQQECISCGCQAVLLVELLLAPDKHSLTECVLCFGAQMAQVTSVGRAQNQIWPVPAPGSSLPSGSCVMLKVMRPLLCR